MNSVLFAALLFCPPPCSGQDYTTVNTPRFTLYIDQQILEPASQVAASADIASAQISSQSLALLNNNFEELSRIFNLRPSKRVVLRFLSPNEFHEQTGAPSWTSAMFYRGEITVPIPTDRAVNMHNLERALRHEYVHAVVAEFSGAKCPAWLDEGLAQLIEGKANPVLVPSLHQWLETDSPLPLNWLEDGFTTLDGDLVPVAYAQSLFATKTLVNSHGFSAITRYLVLRSQNQSHEDAFFTAFGKTTRAFEQQLALQLKRWSETNAENL